MQPPPAGSERRSTGLARVRELRREGGLRRIAVGALAVTVYRRLLIAERSTESGPAPNPLGLACRFLEPPGLDAYEVLRPGQREVAARRLAARSRCFGSWLDTRLVAARWIAGDIAWIDYLGMALPLAADEAYHYDTYTDPGLRGRGVASTSQLLLLAALRSTGVRTSVLAVLPENRPARREAAKEGYRVTGRIGYVRIGGWRHEFARRHSPRSTAYSA